MEDYIECKIDVVIVRWTKTYLDMEDMQHGMTIDGHATRIPSFFFAGALVFMNIASKPP